MSRLFPFFVLLCICNSCTNDHLPEPTAIDCPTTITYTAEIKTIIDKTCSYDGCHISGFSSGDYSSYEGMQSALNSGAFEKRAVSQRNMPPDYAPEDKPKELSAEELELVQCWIQGGFVE